MQPFSSPENDGQGLIKGVTHQYVQKHLHSPDGKMTLAPAAEEKMRAAHWSFPEGEFDSQLLKVPKTKHDPDVWQDGTDVAL